MLDNLDQIMLDSIRSLVDSTSFEEDEKIIREYARRVRSIQSLRQYIPASELLMAIRNKWEMKRIGGLIKRLSREARFIRQVEIVQADLRQQGKRIRLRLAAIQRRQQTKEMLANATNTAVVTNRIILDELEHMRRSIAHSMPRKELEKEVKQAEEQGIKDLRKERYIKDMEDYKEACKLRSEASNVNPFESPEIQQLLKEQEQKYLEDIKKEGK